MRLLPRFREDRVLREQVALVYRNYLPGIVGFYLTTVMAAVVLDIVSDPKNIYLWLTVSTIICAFALFDYISNRHVEFIPRVQAIKQVIALLGMGIIWGLYPLLYSDGESTVIMTTVTSLSAGLAAAALAMQSPCLPVFLAFALPNLTGLTVALFLLGGVVFNALGIASLMFVTVLIWFAMNMERTVKESIELRFRNIDLIDQLQEAITETQEANKAKSVFLASASHDLRQPLHALGLFVEGLRSTPLTESQDNFVSHISAASCAAGEMLNMLLDFSKLDAGVVDFHPKPFQLQPLLNKLENELAASAENKGLIYRTRETPLVTDADPALVELIMRNLISNAIRYTEQGGVLVACRKRSKNTISVEVWDTGIGIPQSEVSNIFKEFHQLGNPERDRRKGFGLGLAIASGLAATSGSEITVDSKLGKGSVFKLLLPESKSAVVEDIPQDRPLTRFDGAHVILIDDEASIRIAMYQLLTAWGCKCEVAESAEEALSILGGRVPDLMIVDYRLRNNQTGGQAIERIRSEIDASIPAAIITGDTAPERLREAQSYHAHLLHKPTSTNQLQITMQDLLGGK
ncbi:MAG: hybrid sensor histidine kinase/response regulator [Acidiferrobacterales bacterium]|nr:hybrid sensor histidine kinase/response regulator [Acidiferrobacterales bacterium]